MPRPASRAFSCQIRRHPAAAAARLSLLVAVLTTLLAASLKAQLAVRPDDPSGLSIREPRVRVIHSEDPSLPGSSMHLQQTDPWMAYQRGRSLFLHEWGRSDSVFERLPASNVAAGATNSCGMCHNLPFRAPGAGGNTAEPVGYGRNTPHLFGAGLIEMLGQQIQAQILERFDANGNGFLDVPAETAGQRVWIEPVPGTRLDFGRLDDSNGDGLPDLNPVLRIKPVDAAGRWVQRGADGRRARLGDDGVAGYEVMAAVFASARSDHQFPTLRVFSNGVLRTVMGVASDDPTTYQGLGERPEHYGEKVWAEVSNAGSRQPNLDLSRESLAAQARTGDEASTMSEGEIDLLEWYLLNHPAPALGRQDERTRHGRRLLSEMGCASCHVPDWNLEAADPERGLAGDRRFFDLEVRYDPQQDGLVGRLRSLAREVARPDGTKVLVPRRDGFKIRDIFTDLLHHDLGERFHEPFYVRGRFFEFRRFRTPPLWGVGSTAPYGHDGRSLTLDDVIRRHGGEAEASRRAYVEASPAEREALLAFLESLVLYQPDVLPADLDGDGAIAPSYRRAGRSLGPERFQPELLFRVAPRYRGFVGSGSERFFSYELLNREEVYGEKLEALLDTNRNLLPDLAEEGSSERR